MLPVTLACWDYDRTRALAEGTVRPDGIALNYLSLPVEETFFRMARFREFDACEMSMSSYCATLHQDEPPFIAIPVYPSRFFRHSCIFVSAKSGITSPEQLRGKRVGVPEYQMTAAVWIRGILQDTYGLRPADIRWRSGGLEEAGREEKSRLALPGIDLQPIPATETLAGQLAAGQIDALISALAPSCFGRDPQVTRLFPDYRAAEEDYYKNTGIFPIMHVVGIRRSLIEKHPWLAVNTLVAYMRAKDICMRNMEKIGHLFTTLPWPVEELQRARALMGHDFWSYGVDNNRRELTAITRYSHEQGLTSRQIPIEELFVPSTLSLAKV